MGKKKAEKASNGKVLTVAEWQAELARGEDAPLEVCRDVLSLARDFSGLELVRALHAQLHRALRSWHDQGPTVATRAIVAARVLVTSAIY